MMKTPLMIKSQTFSHLIPIHTHTKFSPKSSSFLTKTAPCCAKFLRKPTSAKLKYMVIKPHSDNTNQEIASSDPSPPLLPMLSSSEEEDKGGDLWVRLGAAASIGIVVALMAGNDDKAWAFGPEGPLVEEFWENVRRYALYALTVSTGVLYAVVQPIYELLKNPISAILVIIIIGGTLFIGSQILSAMVGVSEFSYQYSY